MYLISSALARAESQYPDQPASICGDTRHSYAELAQRSRRLSGALEALGVKPGDRVATLMLNCHRYLETYFGIPAIGAVLVPLNNRHAVAEHSYICEDADIQVLIVDEAHVEIAHKLRAVVNHVIVAPDGYEALLAAAAEVPAREDLDPESLAGLFYTGGTTGASKGVMLSHRNLMTNSLHLAIATGYCETDRYLHTAPMFHLADGASTFGLTWLGGTHVFLPTFDPGTVLETIAAESVTACMLVPTMINAVVNDPRTANTDLSSLRLILHGGAPIAPDLLRRAIAACGCSFMQAYGMTEAAPVVTVLANEETLVDDERIGSAGRSVAGVEVRVAHPDGSLCDVGEVGEILVRGPNVMSGYWNKPAETAAALRDGWYWSGDLARQDARGYVYIVDRSKDMVISGGENVYSTEVEAAIYAHPAVLEAAVIGIPDTKWGEAVHAVVVLKPEAEVTAEDLRKHCKELIAGYKCPRSVEFVGVLPKSGAGKILKKDLRDPYWAEQGRSVN